MILTNQPCLANRDVLSRSQSPAHANRRARDLSSIHPTSYCPRIYCFVKIIRFYNNTLTTHTMVSLEIALAIGGVMASFTYCAVKIIHQVQNSKCKMIGCCGSKCIRDVDVDLPEAETNPPPTRPTIPARHTRDPPIFSPRPTRHSPPRPRLKVNELKTVFENHIG